MKLLTPELRAKFPALYSQEKWNRQVAGLLVLF